MKKIKTLDDIEREKREEARKSLTKRVARDMHETIKEFGRIRNKHRKPRPLWFHLIKIIVLSAILLLSINLFLLGVWLLKLLLGRLI
jgi:hypothetical protein